MQSSIINHVFLLCNALYKTLLSIMQIIDSLSSMRKISHLDISTKKKILQDILVVT
jgi:hypothetical protein